MNLLLEECANAKKWNECIQEMEAKTSPILVSGGQKCTGGYL